MHIKFTQMEYVEIDVYKESKDSVWIPVEELKRAIVRQEGDHYRLIFLESSGDIEVVKENPIELLEEYEKGKEKDIEETMRKINKGRIK